MNDNYLGKKIKKRRIEMALTQITLAKACGVSVSYLNLIENNKRPIKGKLLLKLSKALECDESYFLESTEANAVQELTDISRDPILKSLSLNTENTHEIAANYPEWSKAISYLYNNYKSVKTTLDDLSDILPGDILPSDSTHKILSLITSIRSFSEILAEESVNDIDRARFSKKIAEESRTLGDISKALVDFLEISTTDTPSPFPMAEVEDFIIERHNYFPEIEQSILELRHKIHQTTGPIEASMVNFINERLNVDVGFSRNMEMFDGKYHYDVGTRKLMMPDILPRRSKLFQLARFISEHAIKDTINDTLSSGSMTNDESQALAFQALCRYSAGAFLLPYDHFFDEVKKTRYDIQLLQQIFDGSFEQICHRLVTLRKPNAEGIPFAFIRTDVAGNLSKRFNLPHLRLPRFGSACPIWVLYRSFKTPDTVCTQLTRMPDNQMFLMISKTVTKLSSHYGFPESLHSVMIACDAIHMDHIVYGDRFRANLENSASNAGINCKLCPRVDCVHRAHPMIHPLTKSFI